MPPKAQGRRRNRNEVKPLSGLNVEALLHGDQKKARISAQNAIPDFRQIINTTDSIDGIRESTQQLGAVIEARIKDSFGDIAYPRALEEIGVMREELIDLEEPEIYNDFAKALKRKLLSEELGGNRRDFWWEFRKSKLGIIEASNAMEEEVKAVCPPHRSCSTVTSPLRLAVLSDVLTSHPYSLVIVNNSFTLVLYCPTSSHVSPRAYFTCT